MRMNCGELVAGLEKKENLFSLSHMPWRIHGVFEDGKLKNEANRMDVAKKQILKNQQVSMQLASFLACEDQQSVPRPTCSRRMSRR